MCDEVLGYMQAVRNSQSVLTNQRKAILADIAPDKKVGGTGVHAGCKYS
jgi:hypothetical protein